MTRRYAKYGNTYNIPIKTKAPDSIYLLPSGEYELVFNEGQVNEFRKIATEEDLEITDEPK